MAICGLLTGYRTTNTSDTIPTEAEVRENGWRTDAKGIYLLVIKFVSMVNLTIFTRALSPIKPRVSLCRFTSCRYPEQNQLLEVQHKGSATNSRDKVAQRR